MNPLQLRDLLATMFWLSDGKTDEGEPDVRIMTLDSCFREAESVLDFSLARDQAAGLRPAGEKNPWNA